MDLVARKYLMNFGYAGIKIAILKDYWGAKFFSTDWVKLCKILFWRFFHSQEKIPIFKTAIVKPFSIDHNDLNYDLPVYDLFVLYKW